MRDRIILACTECKQRNYNQQKKKKIIQKNRIKQIL